MIMAEKNKRGALTMKQVILTAACAFFLTLLFYSQNATANPPPPCSLVVKPTAKAQKQPVPLTDIPLATVPYQKIKVKKPIIVLDAGHGGDDYGTNSLGTTKFYEKHLNLSTTFMVKNFLQKFGFRVLLTRIDDTFIALEDRALFANEKNSKLFVSIHFNSAPSRDAEGIEVFYFRSAPDKQRVEKSKALAQALLDKTLLNTQAKSRGVKHGNYLVLRETQMPAVLIEGGFLTNPDEMERIKDAAYLKSLALGIAQGIQSYLAAEGIFAE